MRATEPVPASRSPAESQGKRGSVTPTPCSWPAPTGGRGTGRGGAGPPCPPPTLSFPVPAPPSLPLPGMLFWPPPCPRAAPRAPHPRAAPHPWGPAPGRPRARTLFVFILKEEKSIDS